MRILLQGAQVLTAFLVVLPFNQSFGKIHPFEKWVFTATFLCSICSMVFFSAPAAHHRLIRPLINRMTFKLFATRMILIGLLFLSFALILVTQLVVWQVLDTTTSILVSTFVGILILLSGGSFHCSLKKVGDYFNAIMRSPGGGVGGGVDQISFF
ncbi:MAG: hypothetical protein IPG53_07475 [Ignavibacteriales bacterium]|nr:hypothetical protein [Ignavibacteriales bacterium]